MPELTIEIDPGQRDLLRDHAAAHNQAVLGAFDDRYVPASPEVRTFLTETRDSEWEALDFGEAVDPEHSANILATAERILLDFDEVA